MKTKVEINGYEIVIEERDGVISVTATLDEEVVEEFQIETEEGQGEGEEEIQGFGEFGQDEEEDFGQGEDEEDDDREEEFGQEDEEDDEEEGALESFQSFINKKK